MPFWIFLNVSGIHEMLEVDEWPSTSRKDQIISYKSYKSPIHSFSLADGQNFKWVQILLRGLLEIRIFWRKQKQDVSFVSSKKLKNKEMFDKFNIIMYLPNTVFVYPISSD